MRELTFFPLLQSYPKTSGYGYRIDPITGEVGSFHRGVDYGAPGGVPVIAPFEGYVTTGNEPSGAGLWLWVQHGPDLFKSFHHSGFIVTAGWVAAGTELAYIDSTGSSTGSHAHFELWDHGVNIDPTGYFDRAPLYGQEAEDMPLTQEDLNAITSIVGMVVDNRIDQFATNRQLFQSGNNFWEAAWDGCERVRRKLRGGELLLLRGASELSEQPFVDVDHLEPAQRDAFYAWPEV